MKFSKRIAFGIITALLFTSVFVGCTADITKSKNYQTYELKYLVNLSQIENDNEQNTVDELKKVLKSRINLFDVAEDEITQTEENGNFYITLSFGTINDINEIKKALEQNEAFAVMKQFNTATEDATTEEDTAAEENAETGSEPEGEEDYETKAKEHVQKVLDSALQEGEVFDIITQNEVINDPQNIAYIKADWMYKDEVKKEFADIVFDMEPGTVYPEIVSYQHQSSPFAPTITIYSIIKLEDKKEVERINSYPKQVEVSHILIAYKDSLTETEEETITRTKEEAQELANELKEKLNNGEAFETLAKEYSNDNSNSNSGGKLVNPAGFGGYVEPFEKAALKLEEVGEISDVTETSFGYHIIKADKITPASEESQTEEQVKFNVLFFAAVAPTWEKTDLYHNHIKTADVLFDKDYNPFIKITLNAEGKELLKKLTEENMGKIFGLFLGSQIITSFNVHEVNESGELIILTPTTTKEADELKKSLTTKLLPVPIILIEETTKEKVPDNE